MLGLLDTAPTLRRGTDILLADDDTWGGKDNELFWEQKAELHKIKNVQQKVLFYLLLYGLESVVGRRQTVAVRGEPRSCVGFDEREGRLVLLPRNLQQELNTAEPESRVRKQNRAALTSSRGRGGGFLSVHTAATLTSNSYDPPSES